MKPLRTFEEIIRGNEFAEMIQRVPSDIPSEIVQIISFAKRDFVSEELPLYLCHDPDISSLVSNYVYESHSIFEFTFLCSSDQIGVYDVDGHLFQPFFTDMFDNSYLLADTDASLYFYGSDWKI